jgi:3-oxoadipate enol-lactonase
MSGLDYELSGPAEAPVIVLSSSIGTTRAMWDQQVAQLETRWRVLRYDHPGHGGSPDPEVSSVPALARQLYALIGELEIERFSLWGLSMGGTVAMYIAAHHPEQIDRLVLSATALRFPSPDPWNDRARAVRENGLESIADMVMSRYFSEAFREAEPATVSAFRDGLCECSPEGYARCCEALGKWAFDDAPSILAPTLVLVGGEDNALPAVLTEAVAEAIPGARLETVPGAGHLLTVEKPPEVAAAVLAHLQP